MKKKSSLLIIAGIAFFASVFLKTACTNKETAPQEKRAAEETITITASMPYNGPATRLELAETNEGDIIVKWKAGDKINLCFVSGETVKTLNNVPVINIREEGKKADFNFTLPEGIQEPFNLYGVYGAALAENSKTVTLPAAITSGSALSDTEPVCVMRFAKENVMPGTLVSVNFTHLGSLMSVALRNCAETSYQLNSLSLSGNEGYNWLYNASGQAQYDIVNGTFTDTKEGGALNFPLPQDGLHIAAGATEKLYAWITPTSSPDLSKTISASFNGSAMQQNLPAKAITAGKYYRLKLTRKTEAWKPLTLPPSSDLVAHWPMDGNANDVSGNNHHGTIMGGVTPTEDHRGVPNKAYLFDGADGSYIDLGAWENGGPMTFTFWAKWNELRTWSRIIELNKDPGRYNNGIVIANKLGSRTLSFHILKRSNTIYEATASNIIPQPAEWAFYAASVNTDGVMKIYQNYSLKATKTDGVCPENILRDIQYIGRSSFSNDSNFKGAIDDLRIYNRTLTDEEILGIYLSTK